MINWIWCPRCIPKLDPQGFVTGVTTTSNFYVVPLTLHLELLNRSRIIRGVLGTYNANDTILRRSAQLLLTAENHHFEASMHLKSQVSGPRAFGTVLDFFSIL